MRRFWLILLSLAVSVAVGPPHAAAGELAQMYPPAVLAKDRKRLATAVEKIFKLGLMPHLRPAERRALADVAFEFPMPRDGDDPLNFYAYRAENGQPVMVLPVLSLKALEDMTTAYAWVQVNGFRHDTVDLYYAMLRHRPASRFPGRRYVDVLTALGIPEKAYEQPGVDKLSLALRNEAYAFLIGHELAHLLLDHRGYGEISKAQARADEVAADRFALDLMSRSATPPLGAVLFFQAQVYRFRHRGEFATQDAWEDYLMTVSTHPTTVSRIRAMARHIAGPLARGRGGEKVVWVGIGHQLDAVANILDDQDLPRCMAQVAARAPFEILRPATSDVNAAMLKYCR